MMKIKNVVFDLGGVIIDLDRDRAAKRFREVGVDNIDDLLDSYEHKGAFLELENGTIGTEEFRLKLSDMTGKELTMDEVHYGWHGFVANVPTYKLDYILGLRKDYSVYVLSNINPVVLDWAKTPAFSEAGLPVTAYCEKFYASYELKVTKPDPRIFELMIQDSGMVPDETLFIDDGWHNVEVGKRLGFNTYHPLNKEDWREPVDRLLKR